MPIPAAPRPIRTLLLALVVMTQVPAVLALATLAYVEYLRQREFVEDNMVERSRVAAVAMREYLEKVEASLEALAREVPRDPARLGEFHALAQSRLESIGADAIVLATPRARVALSTHVPWGERLPHAFPVALETLRTGKRSIIDLTAPTASAPPAVGVGVPVVQDSRIEYVLVASIPPTRLRDLLQQQALPPGWIGAIVDSQGVIVARVPSHHAYVGRNVTRDLDDRLVAAERGTGPMVAVFESQTLAGIDVVTSMRRSPFNGWTIIVSVPRALLLAPVWQSLSWAGSVFLLLLAASVTAAIVVSTRIARSVGHLRDAAAALPAGIPVPPGPMSFAEGDELARTILEAARAVHASRDEVHRVSRNFHRTLMREIESRQMLTARELHDSVGSTLAGVSLLLANATRQASGSAVSRLLAKAHEQVTHAAQEVREISRGMTPAGMEAGGLVPAIEHLASDITLFQGVDCTLRARGDFSGLPPEDGTHVYRIVQEACANAVRHGGADAIRITLVERRGCFRLSVRDDGPGCDFNSLSLSHPGLGLRSMQARAHEIGGHLDLGCPPHGGCWVRVTWRAQPQEDRVEISQRPVAEVA